MYDYLNGAFVAVSRGMALEFGLPEKVIKGRLLELADKHGYLHEKLFNIWLGTLGLENKQNIELCVKYFHTYCPEKLELYPGVKRLLNNLKKTYSLRLVTDGNASTQRKKIKLLAVEDIFDRIVLTYEHGIAKPDRRSFLRAFDGNRVPSGAMFIGDHPEKDMMGAKRAGMQTVRVLRGEFSRLKDVEGYEPDFVIEDTVNLEKILEL
jgi:putative hydrolase of the HAD superfamily